MKLFLKLFELRVAAWGDGLSQFFMVKSSSWPGFTELYQTLTGWWGGNCITDNCLQTLMRTKVNQRPIWFQNRMCFFDSFICFKSTFVGLGIKFRELHLDDLNMPYTFMVAFGANWKEKIIESWDLSRRKLWWPEVASIRRGLSKWWFITVHPVLSSHQPNSTSHPSLLVSTLAR